MSRLRQVTVDRWAPPLYALVDLLVIMIPSVAVKAAADRGGMGSTDGLDLLATSLVLGIVHALVAGRRLIDEERMAVRRADMWIAAVDALVVLAVGATAMLLVVLHTFVDDHASLANQGWPVFILWGGVQLVAIALAEAVGRAVFWWLETNEQRHDRRTEADRADPGTVTGGSGGRRRTRASGTPRPRPPRRTVPAGGGRRSPPA